MSSFGKSSGGGRRGGDRLPIIAPAVLTSVTRSQSIIVLETSRTGAKLQGGDLPKSGELIILKLGGLRAFASVIWTRGSECGVQFDVELTHEVVERLREQTAGTVLSVAKLVQSEALQDWTTGFAR